MSKKKRRKKKRKGPQPLSPKKYVMAKARNLPVCEVLINNDWENAGMADILIARKHKNDHITCGFYLVDLFCLGVKETFYAFNMPPFQYDEVKEKYNTEHDLVDCEYALAHNIIYSATNFARRYGFEPHREFAITQYLLESEDQDIPSIEIEFGESGKPCVVTTLEDEPADVIKQLEKTAGTGNYRVVYVDDDGYAIIEDDDDLFDEAIENWELAEDEPVIGESLVRTANGSYEIEFDSPRKLTYEFRDKDNQLREYVLSFDPIESGYYFSDEEDLEMAEELHHMSSEKPTKAIPILQKTIKKFPQNPVYYNYLANAYLKAHDKKASDQVIEYSYQRFPDYLFAKCNFAYHLLRKGKADKVPSVFDSQLPPPEVVA